MLKWLYRVDALTTFSGSLFHMDRLGCRRCRVWPMVRSGDWWRLNGYYRTLIGNIPSLSNGSTFNDLDCPLTVSSRSRYFSTLNISETTREWAMVTIEHQYVVIWSLSNGDIFNDSHGPLIRFSRSRYFWSRISQKHARTDKDIRTKLL